jgi:hypothetical protein
LRITESTSVVKIGGQVVPHGADGSFQYDAPLPVEKNVIQITATNSGKTPTVIIHVTRLYTEEEKAKQQTAIEIQRKVKEEAEAKAKAEQATFDASRAGKICKQHPTWSHEVCQNVSERKYWIGMDLDMLKASYGGNPDHANPSNYGGETRWQWCWSDYTPSCFYGGSDGIITSYN